MFKMYLKQNILLFVLFISASTINLFAQGIDKKNNMVDSLWILINKITPTKRSEFFDNKLVKFKKITIDENDLEQARELMYYAYAHAPLELRKKENVLFEEWGKTDFTELKPNERKKIIEKAIEEKYGKDYLGFLKTPYFMRVKILDISKSIYPTNKRIRATISQINLKVKIIDILKGNKYYTEGDTITIAYLPTWFMLAEAYPNFRVGEEYIIPLTHWNEPKDDILQMRLRGLHTLFQVKDNQVYTPLIKSSFAESWSDFKNEFEQKYLIK